MGSIGLAIVYGFKVNVSVAIVAMVNGTALKLAAEHAKKNVSLVLPDDICIQRVATVDQSATEVSFQKSFF